MCVYWRKTAEGGRGAYAYMHMHAICCSHNVRVKYENRK